MASDDKHAGGVSPFQSLSFSLICKDWILAILCYNFSEQFSNLLNLISLQKIETGRFGPMMIWCVPGNVDQLSDQLDWGRILGKSSRFTGSPSLNDFGKNTG